MPDCLFCRIVSGDIPAQIVYEDADTVAFRDIEAQAPVHVLVVPRRHVADLGEAVEADPALASKVAQTAVRVAEQEGVATTGYRSVINTGPDASQSVPHLHLHVLGGRAMGWPPG
jgi:histidine triad (HIT) family protein